MGEIRDNVKRNLGYFLSLRGISQKELSEKLSVSQSAVTNWIRGKNSPDIEMVAKICEVLGISVLDLFGTNLTFSSQEEKIIEAYRRQPELRVAVERVLGIYKDDREYKKFLKEREEYINSIAQPYAAADGDTSNLEEAQNLFDESDYIDKDE